MERHILVRAYFYLVVLFVCTGVYSMDLPDHRFYAVMPTTTYAAGSFLLTYKMDLFNHDMICSLALVNKEWESIVKSAAPKLKACLATKLPEFCFGFKENTIVWHAYGTAWGKKCVYTCDGGSNALLGNEKKNGFSFRQHVLALWRYRNIYRQCYIRHRKNGKKYYTSKI